MGRIFVVGSANIDLVAPLAALPRAGETVAAGDLTYVPGGKGANQACAAARMGAETHLIARIGSDTAASVLIESLQNAGVQTRSTKRLAGSTGTAFIFLLPDGENSIVISPGANAALTAEAAVASLDDLTGADCVLLQLEIPLRTVEAVLLHANEHGARTILDPAPAFPLPCTILELATILTPNQVELAFLCQAGEPATIPEAARLVRELRTRGARTVVAKLGALGCFISGQAAAEHVPAFPVEAVDTTAAGDVFNGALAAALIEGCSLPEAVRFGNAAAAISVTRFGAQSSIPRREEVDTFVGTRFVSECAPVRAEGAPHVHR